MTVQTEINREDPEQGERPRVWRNKKFLTAERRTGARKKAWTQKWGRHSAEQGTCLSGSSRG